MDEKKVDNNIDKSWETSRVSFKNEVYKKGFLMGFAILFVAFLFTNSGSIYNYLGKLLGIIIPFILGAVIAFIMKIPLNFLEDKLFDKIKSEKFQKFKRPISIAISFILIILAVWLIIAIILPQLVNSFYGLRDSLPSFLQMAIDKTREIPYINEYSDELQKQYDSLSWNGIFQKIESFIKSDDNSQIFSTALATASNIIGGVVTFFIGIITSIYILSEKERLGYQFTRMFYSFFDNNIANKIVHVAHILHDNFYGFIRGQITVSTFMGIATFIFCFILQMPNAATLGVIVGVTDLIPIIGPFIGGAMGFVMIVIEEPAKAVGFVILIIILQQLESNIVYPKLVGGEVGLPSLWTLIAITVGGSLFGVVGMWGFIPLFSTIYELLKEYTEYKIDKKNLDLRMKKI